ncbi:hypothetical protein GIB67_031959, partial [Kingdonia uniflora]
GWQPSLSIFTILTSIGLLLSEPNPDYGLMCEAMEDEQLDLTSRKDDSEHTPTRKKLSGVNRMLSLESSVPLQSKSHEKEKVMHTSILSLLHYQNVSKASSKSVYNESAPCQDHDDKKNEFQTTSKYVDQQSHQVHEERSKNVSSKASRDKLLGNGLKLKLSLKSLCSPQDGKRGKENMVDARKLSVLPQVQPEASSNLLHCNRQQVLQLNNKKIQNDVINMVSNKQCGIKKKLSLGISGSPKNDDDNKENVPPFYQLKPQSIPVYSPKSLPMSHADEHNDNLFHQNYLGDNTKQNHGETETSLISENLIVLDSKDSEEEMKGPTRSRVLFARMHLFPYRDGVVLGVDSRTSAGNLIKLLNSPKVNSIICSDCDKNVHAAITVNGLFLQTPMFIEASEVGYNPIPNNLPVASFVSVIGGSRKLKHVLTYEEQEAKRLQTNVISVSLFWRIKKSDGPLTGEVVLYNIVPLDALALTNAIGTFAEATVRGLVTSGLFVPFGVTSNPGRMTVGAVISAFDGNLMVSGNCILSNVRDNILISPNTGNGSVNGAIIDVKQFIVEVILSFQESFRAVLQGNINNELEICLESGDLDVEQFEGNHLVFVVAGPDSFDVITNVVMAVENHLQTFYHREKKKAKVVIEESKSTSKPSDTTDQGTREAKEEETDDAAASPRWRNTGKEN